MKLTIAMLVSTLAWTACSVAATAPTVDIEPEMDFSLKVGEVAQLVGGALQIGVEGVTADSRCPKGEQCVWAGDATVRVWLRQGSGPKELRELHAAPGSAPAVGILGHGLTLVRLEPAPVTGRTIAGNAYLATLRLSRNPPRSDR